MYSVEPLSSAACTTSNGTSGCTITLMPGCSARTFSICFAVKRTCTEQWPFHRISFARVELLARQPAERLVRIPHHHLIERHAHLERGVAAEMLVGQEQDLLLLLPAPLQRGGGVRRRADGAAVLADERLNRRGGVDVGDRHHARSEAQLRELRPADLELIGRRHVGHRAAGGEVRQDDLLVRHRQDVGALGHEVHAAEHDVVGVRVLARSRWRA